MVVCKRLVLTSLPKEVVSEQLYLPSQLISQSVSSNV